MVVIFTSFSLAYVRSVMHYYFYSLSHYFPVVDTVFFFFFFLCFFLCFLFLFFFFFQAEDGIRDKLVTGVQTCALPIYPYAPADILLQTDAGADRGGLHLHRAAAALPRGQGQGRAVRLRPEGARRDRSEERRVGKECRSRWTPDQ